MVGLALVVMCVCLTLLASGVHVYANQLLNYMG